MSEDQIRDLLDHLSFKSMKGNRSITIEDEKSESQQADEPQKEESKFRFIRRGEAGQWKEVMSEAMVTRFRKWEAECLGDSDYPLVYE